MANNRQTRDQLLAEVDALRRRITELEQQRSGEQAAQKKTAFQHNLQTADFDEIFDAIGDPVSVQDTEYAVLYQNRAHRAFVGNHVGERCYEAYALKSRVCDHCPIALTFSDGGIHTVEKPGTKDILRVEITSSALRNTDGKIVAGIEVVRDISKRVRAEEGLRSAETQFRDLVEHSLTGIYILQNDRFTYVNPLTAEIFGYTQAEMISSVRPLDLVAEEDRQVVADNIRKLRDGSAKTVHETIRGIRKDGSAIEIETQGSLTDYQGSPAIIGTLLDITDRKKLEFTAEQNRRLESISTFAGGIANEFNNILTAIIGNLAIAKMYAKPGYEVYDVLAEAEKASFRARDLTAQLLDFARHGENAVMKKRLALPSMLHGIGTLPRANASISAELAVPENLWQVEGDGPKLAEALSALFLHVQKLTIDGGILRLHAENSMVSALQELPLSSGAYVVIAFEAQRPEVSPKSLPRVFDPLHGHFSSLGLTNAYAIIRKHGGQVTTEAIPGRGTIFRVYLPALAEARSAVAGEETYLHDRGRVLVMDDEEIIRLVIGRLLLQCGYETDVVSNGEEMLEAYRRAKAAGTPYTAVILDLMIQNGMGGQEAIGHLLSIDPKARAIVSSGYANDPAFIDYRQFGFRGFLAKPYKMEELRLVLHEVTSGHR